LLEYLDCSHNCLKCLPSLPFYLYNLQCEYNYITYLPKLTPLLEILNCNSNQIEVIPELSNKLRSLLCSKNYLDLLPEFPVTLNWLRCNNNPYIYGGFIDIYYIDKHGCDYNSYISNKNIIDEINYEFQKIRKWRTIYFYLKFKIKFIQWYFKSQKKKIQDRYHPSKIIELLDKNIEIEELELHL
jgi:Leucine-rich repeat (LRR) protein